MKLLVIFQAALLSLFLAGCHSAPEANLLAVGAQASTTETLSIDLNRPIDLNLKTNEEVLSLRRFFVEQRAALLAKPYKPSSYVFGELKDRSFWWGEAGYFVFGKGAKASQGRSVEGRYLLNPFLLLAPEFWGLTIWYTKKVKWDPAKIGADALTRDDFPFYCKPENLEWHPADSSASVSYDLTSFLRDINQFVSAPLTIDDVFFGLNSINAKDFDLNYLFLDPANSKSIRNPNQNDQTVQNDMRLIHTDNCGLEGGCNVFSGIPKRLNYVVVEKVPAAASFKLWRVQPSSVNEKADFRFDINIR